MRLILTTLLAALALSLSGCGYNDFQRLDEQTKSAWSEVLNQYQRRADLIPNIVATVKGETNFEQETLTRVVEARAKATSIQATPELVNNPEAFQKFQAVQGELSGALSRLLVVSENYPQLKANQGFQELRAQLEGHREPHHRGPRALCEGGAGLQRPHAQLPDQHHGQGVQLRRQAELLRRRREGDGHAAPGRLRRLGTGGAPLI